VPGAGKVSENYRTDLMGAGFFIFFVGVFISGIIYMTSNGMMIFSGGLGRMWQEAVVISLKV
jgi:hypothetical protein